MKHYFLIFTLFLGLFTGGAEANITRSDLGKALFQVLKSKNSDGKAFFKRYKNYSVQQRKTVQRMFTMVGKAWGDDAVAQFGKDFGRLGGSLKKLNTPMTVPEFLDRFKVFEDKIRQINPGRAGDREIANFLRRMSSKSSENVLKQADFKHVTGAGGEAVEMARLAEIDSVTIVDFQKRLGGKEFREATCRGRYPTTQAGKELDGEFYLEVKSWPSMSTKSGKDELRGQVESHIRRASKDLQQYQGADVGSWPGVLYRFPGVKGPEEFEAFQKVIEATFERNARDILGEVRPKLQPEVINLKVKDFLKKIVVEQG